jgi:hypothetical protein
MAGRSVALAALRTELTGVDHSRGHRESIAATVD